jgi:hypothetical protein
MAVKHPMRYEQLTPAEALGTYCDWLLEQQFEDESGRFFRIANAENQPLREWYMIFYGCRSLLLASQLLNQPTYAEATWKYFDDYVGEQLPNGGFTSNSRNQPTSTLGRREFFDILRFGKVNLADHGTNTHALIQAAATTSDPERRQRYLDAVKRWYDGWVSIWALPNGTYGNGIWIGQKLNAPYTMAINICTSFAAYALVTGDREFMENAENFALFQCREKWLPDGRPIRMNCYPLPEEDSLIDDYSRMFYLSEALCWVHHASRREEVRSVIAATLKNWIFGECGILKQWTKGMGWFRFSSPGFPLPSGKVGTFDTVPSLPWQLAKSAAIPHVFSCYLNHIEESAELREYFEEGVRFLSHPLRARSLGIGIEPGLSCSTCSVQATGFAGLSLAEAVRPDSAFQAFGPSIG